MATGKEIKRLRGKKYTAAEVAGFLNVGVDKLRKWEERDSDPSDTGDIQKIEQYFGVPIAGLKNINSFDFVQNAGITDYRDKYISSLEKQVKYLENQVNLITGQLRHVALLTCSLVETNQEALAEILVKQKIAEAGKVAGQLSTKNAETYQRMKDELNIV